MARKIHNSLERHRRLRGWTQADLAERAQASRAAVSAIETGRHVPSTEVALALAQAFECRIEDLFQLARPALAPVWAWPPRRSSRRFFRARVLGRTVLYPAEETCLGMPVHDGVGTEGRLEIR